MWQILRRVIVVAGAVVLAASFAGRLHPMGDSLAVFRPVLAMGLLVAALMVWRERWAQIAGLVAAAVVGVHLWGLVPKGEDAPDAGGFVVTVYQKNMLFLPHDRALLIADVRSVDADFVTLQEVSRANLPALQALRGHYPHQVLCNGHSVGAVAVLSKTPFEVEDCGHQAGFGRGVARLEGRRIQIYAVHLHWPWPFGQAGHVRAMLRDFAPLEDGVTVVGGDFNMVASGHTLAQIAAATDTARVGHLVETFRLFGLYPLGIDHVLATGGQGRIHTRDLLGADHRGVVAEITFN